MHMFSFQSKGFGKAFPSTKNVNARPDVRHILKNFPATDCLDLRADGTTSVSWSIWNATQIDVTVCETKEYVIEDAPKLPSLMDNCEFSPFYIALSNSSNKTNRLIISCGRFRNPSRSIRASQNENNQCNSWLNQYTTRINISKFDREVNMF